MTGTCHEVKHLDPLGALKSLSYTCTARNLTFVYKAKAAEPGTGAPGHEVGTLVASGPEGTVTLKLKGTRTADGISKGTWLLGKVTGYKGVRLTTPRDLQLDDYDPVDDDRHVRLVGQGRRARSAAGAAPAFDPWARRPRYRRVVVYRVLAPALVIGALLAGCGSRAPAPTHAAALGARVDRQRRALRRHPRFRPRADDDRRANAR